MMIDREFDQKLHTETLKNDVRMSQLQILHEGVRKMMPVSENVICLQNLIDPGVCYIS